MAAESPGDVESKPAPGALRRVQAFVNTVDRESGWDVLADEQAAAGWLAANGLLTPADKLTPDELDITVEVRESLRALAVHNSGGPAPAPAATAALHALADAVTVRARVDDHGRVALVASGDSVRDRLLALLLTVKDAQLDGSWAHLKACANDDCLWAFYDRSRNHGGTWCDMATCGNKLKNRDFRARRRST